MEDAPSSPSQYYLFDFNPHSVRVAQMEGVKAYMTEEDRRMVCTSSTTIDPAFAFAEEVSSRLPYVVTESGGHYAFDGVLLDEERILGIYVSWRRRLGCVPYLQLLFRRMGRIGYGQLRFTILGNSSVV